MTVPTVKRIQLPESGDLKVLLVYATGHRTVFFAPLVQHSNVVLLEDCLERLLYKMLFLHQLYFPLPFQTSQRRVHNPFSQDTNLQWLFRKIQN